MAFSILHGDTDWAGARLCIWRIHVLSSGLRQVRVCVYLYIYMRVYMYVRGGSMCSNCVKEKCLRVCARARVCICERLFVFLWRTHVVHMCLCVYACILVCTFVYLYAHISIPLDDPCGSHVCLCMYAHVLVCTSVYLYEHISICLKDLCAQPWIRQVCMCVYVYICICVSIFACVLGSVCAARD